MLPIALTCVSILLAGLRISGIKHIAFQAVAHVFVGGLFAVWLTNRKPAYYLHLTIFLSVVEVACAIFFSVFHA